MKEKIIRSTQFTTGNIPSKYWEQIREHNENPTFNPSTKPYKFIEKIKSDTRNHGWLFSVGDDYYLALQHYALGGATECVSIYESDKKQSFSVDNEPIKKYITYVDIETVVDMFVQNELGISLNVES